MDDRLRLMLQAALLEGERGREAWLAWKAHAAGALSPEERQVAPTLARALARRGVADAEAEVLQAHARVAWIAHQTNRSVAGGVLRHLHATGIETVVLKGTALVPAYYGDSAARRAGDVDVLVREAQFSEAWDSLTALGWRPVGTDRRHFDPRYSHAVQLIDHQGHSVDLHCHVLAVSCERGADDAFWDAALPIDVGGCPTKMLCATDQLLHVCVHGLIRPAILPVRWYADAIMILRGAGDAVDWMRFRSLAEARRVTLFAAAALEELIDLLGVSIPDDVLPGLRALPTSVLDRMVFRSLQSDSRGRLLLRAQVHAGRFLRGTAGLGLSQRLRRLPAFLRMWLLTDSWSRLVARLIYRGGRAVAIRLGWLPREAASGDLLKALSGRSR